MYFGRLRRSFKGTSKCFYYEVFRIELRSECVNTKNFEFFSWNVLTFQCCYGNVFWSVGAIS